MNIHTLKYRMTRNFIREAVVREALLTSLSVCALEAHHVEQLADIEERLPVAWQIVDRLRFLAKHDRSKYVPHQGQQEKDRRNVALDRPMCDFLNPLPMEAT